MFGEKRYPPYFRNTNKCKTEVVTNLFLSQQNSTYEYVLNKKQKNYIKYLYMVHTKL